MQEVLLGYGLNAIRILCKRRVLFHGVNHIYRDRMDT